MLDLVNSVRDAWAFDVRKTILEAHATLYYVNEFDLINPKVIEDLKALVKVTIPKT
jgi:hypothetical protein